MVSNLEGNIGTHKNCLIDIKGWGTKNKEAEFPHHRLIFYAKNVSFCIFDIIHRLEIVGALEILEMFNCSTICELFWPFNFFLLSSMSKILEIFDG